MDAKLTVTQVQIQHKQFKKSQREATAASPPPKKSCIPAGNFRLSPTYNTSYG